MLVFTGCLNRTSHRKQNRGRISMHQGGQHIAPSILFPVRRSIQPPSNFKSRNSATVKVSRRTCTAPHRLLFQKSRKRRRARPRLFPLCGRGQWQQQHLAAPGSKPKGDYGHTGVPDLGQEGRFDLYGMVKKVGIWVA